MTTKRVFYFTTILLIGLISCNPKTDFSKIVPDSVNKFAIRFVSEVHKGNIDSCGLMILPEKYTEEAKQFLTNVYSNIQTFPIDSFSIINASKTTLLGDNGYTKYTVDYEYVIKDKFLYFTFIIIEQKGKLSITAFDGRILANSLAENYAFTFKDKGFLHYLFFFLAILIPIFIIVTLIFALKTKLTKKWLWIIGILLGFIKFSLNWTTGQFMFNLINFSILGAGFTKSGNVSPWILSFSIPFVAIVFWIKRYKTKKDIAKEINQSEKIEIQELNNAEE